MEEFQDRTTRSFSRARTAGALVLLVALIAVWQAVFAAPRAFPSEGVEIQIEEGSSLGSIAHTLESEHVIAHPGLFSLSLRLSGNASRIQAGTYLFKEPEPLLRVAARLVRGDEGVPLVKLILKEGERTSDLATRVTESFPDIAASDFKTQAAPLEGYLFPDTYHFRRSVRAADITEAMRKHFDEKIAPLQEAIDASPHTLSDIVTMASLLEKEARTTEVRRTVAGILWHRLELGMPLQVDAVFGFIFDRDTYSPTYDDLKVDSPYNTYRYAGLPPGPINNPGLDAISAALSPIETNYLYYLTDADGVMHYAKTYAEHQANQRRYLR